MDLTMSIASMSVGLNQWQLGQDLGIAVLKKTMDMSENGTVALLEALDGGIAKSEELAAQPYLGANVDISL